jgi:hypothetical protein
VKSQTVVSWVRLTSSPRLLLALCILCVASAACAAPLVVAPPKAVPFWPAFVGLRDTNDNPLSSGTISTYDTTTASKSMYLDALKTQLAPNPIVLDQFGRASGNSGKGPIFADGNYNIVVRNASGSTVYSLSNVEFKSIAYPGSLNLSSSIVASLTAYMAQIDAGSIASVTIDGSVITNSQITNASMSTIDGSGNWRIDTATITAAHLGTVDFHGGAGSVGNLPGTNATFSGTVGIGGNLIVTGDASIQGSFFEVLADMGVSGTLYNASGLQIIGNTIYNVATPTASTQAANRGYVDGKFLVDQPNGSTYGWLADWSINDSINPISLATPTVWTGIASGDSYLLLSTTAHTNNSSYSVNYAAFTKAHYYNSYPQTFACTMVKMTAAIGSGSEVILDQDFSAGGVSVLATSASSITGLVEPVHKFNLTGLLTTAAAPSQVVTLKVYMKTNSPGMYYVPGAVTLLPITSIPVP